MNAVDRWHGMLAARLDDAALPWSAERVYRWGGAGTALALGLSLVVGGWPVLCVAVIAIAIGAWVGLDALRGRAASQVDRALPDVLEATARSLRSGASLRIAMQEASENAPARLRAGLVGVTATAERGVPLVDAIDAWSAEVPGEGVRLAAAALALSAEVGGAAARSLDGVAATLRDRNGLRREVRALSSQARASALVIGLAPVGFAMLAAAVDPRTIDFLLRTPAGVACLLTGVVLDGLGALWMHRLAAVT
jgi:tight adherence protein B